MDDLQRFLKVRLDYLLAATENFVDETLLTERRPKNSEPVQRKMTEQQLLAQNRREAQSGRLFAMSARHQAACAQKAYDEDDQGAFLYHLTYGLQRLSEALAALANDKPLTTMPGDAGAPKRLRDEALYVTALPFVEQEMKIADAITAAIAAHPELAHAFRNTSDAAKLSAYKRGKKKTAAKA